MKNDKIKGYLGKRQERFANGERARSRVGTFRANEHVSHVYCQKEGSEYMVSYSVAKRHVEEIRVSVSKIYASCVDFLDLEILMPRSHPITIFPASPAQ